MTPDRTDFAIIKALQNDARISNKDLAEKVGLAPSSCLERVRKLRQAGVIRSFAVEIDQASLGIGLQAIITVQLFKNAQSEGLFNLRQEIMSRPEVVQLFHVAGVKDFLVHIVVRDVNHLKQVGYDVFQRPEISHIETAIIFDHDRATAYPNLNEKPQDQSVNAG